MNVSVDNKSKVPSVNASNLNKNKREKAKAARELISEYCERSTIHGVRYLGERRPNLEKLFWAAIFLVSIYACAQLTTNIWIKWDQSPVIVSFAEKSTPIWEIPFPTVTICPENKARQILFNFTDTFWKIFYEKLNETTEEQISIFEAIAQVCLIRYSKVGNMIVNKTIIEILEGFAVEFDETFVLCKWRNMYDNCYPILRKVITEEGICYTFNSLDVAEMYRNESVHDELIDHMFEDNFSKKSSWILEDGYSSVSGVETFPVRVLAAGAEAGLFVSMRGTEFDYDSLCRGPVPGFKVSLTTPGEIPQVSRQYYRVPFGQEVLISIKPNIISTSLGLKNYSPDRRQCYFQKERYLRYFQVYTQANCELECLANYTLKKCGCVKFSMPRNASIPICGGAKIECYKDAEDILLFEEYRQRERTSALNDQEVSQCNCLPACTSIAYEAEISQANIDFEKLANAYGEVEFEKIPGRYVSRLFVFFKENQFLTSKRSELYGTTDFLASCGGLLGLFMGVSTISIVELLYFCTLRLRSNLKMRREPRKQSLKIQMD